MKTYIEQLRKKRLYTGLMIALPFGSAIAYLSSFGNIPYLFPLNLAIGLVAKEVARGIHPIRKPKYIPF